MLWGWLCVAFCGALYGKQANTKAKRSAGVESAFHLKSDRMCAEVTEVTV